MLFQRGYQNPWQFLRRGFTTDLQKNIGLCSDLLVSASSLTVWNHHKNSMLRRICSELADRKCSEHWWQMVAEMPPLKPTLLWGFPSSRSVLKNTKPSHEEHSMASYTIYCIVCRALTGSARALVQFTLFCWWWFKAILLGSRGALIKVNLQVGLLPSEALTGGGSIQPFSGSVGPGGFFLSRTALKEGIESVFSSD